eukprot:6205477-Pleurochrysis_carterae.AAC.1
MVPNWTAGPRSGKPRTFSGVDADANLARRRAGQGPRDALSLSLWLQSALPAMRSGRAEAATSASPVLLGARHGRQGCSGAARGSAWASGTYRRASWTTYLTHYQVGNMS